MLRFILAASICALILNSPVALAQSQRPAGPSADSAGRTQLPSSGATRQNAEAPGRAAVQPAAQIILDNKGLPQDNQVLPPEMERLLQAWADESAKIKRLEGEHLRRVYDSTFEVEKLSEGKFYFEAPDKGRIDLVPTAIDPKMLAQRANGTIKCLKKKNKDGTPSAIPYELKGDQAENWVCNGIQVYDINIDQKEADVMQLPPDLQGAQIMDGPLPFLFGMPPDRAKRRFLLSFTQTFDPKSGKAHLTAEPRLPQDAQNWKRADVILDLRTFLPDHVRLTDPTGNEVTVYSFTNMEINKVDWLRLPGIPKKDLFTPDLRGYQVNVIQTEAQGGGIAKREDNTVLDQPRQAQAQPPQAQPPQAQPAVAGAVPNVTGMDYRDAVISLERMGLQRNVPEAERTILLAPGPVAQRTADIYKVHSQNPEPGTPLKPGMKVSLTIWNKPAEPGSK